MTFAWAPISPNSYEPISHESLPDINMYWESFTKAARDIFGDEAFQETFVDALSSQLLALEDYMRRILRSVFSGSSLKETDQNLLLSQLWYIYKNSQLLSLLSRKISPREFHILKGSIHEGEFAASAKNDLDSWGFYYAINSEDAAVYLLLEQFMLFIRHRAFETYPRNPLLSGKWVLLSATVENISQQLSTNLTNDNSQLE